MQKKSDKATLALAFGFALASFLVLPVVWPFLRLTYFAPFLVVVLYKRPLKEVLWFAFGCGLFMDLFSDEPRLGILALSYVAASFILFKQKQHFYQDHWTTVPALTLIFVEITTVFHLAMRGLFGAKLHLTWEWAITDLLIMPMLDAIYAFILFTWPALFMPKSKKREYFLRK